MPAILAPALRVALSCLVVITACTVSSDQSASIDRSASQPLTAARTMPIRSVSTTGDSPVAALSLYLDGFHFYNGDPHSQAEAHFYCARLNDDLTQCVMFDSASRT